MRAVDQPLRIEGLSVRNLAPGDVRVRIEAASICHTDLDVLQGTRPVPLPIVLGREGAGVIEAVGSEVSEFRIGERVVLSWNPYCGECFYCANDQPTLCARFTHGLGLGLHVDGRPCFTNQNEVIHHLMYLGTFSEVTVVPSQMAVEVPAELPADRGCLLGCAVMTGFGAATNVAPVRFGSSVAVIGCGAIGLSAIQAARIAGASRILAIGHDSRQLDRARAVGASDTLRVGAGDPRVAARAISDDRGADYVFECTGHADALPMSLECARPGGQVVWLGELAASEDVSIQWARLMAERHIIHSRYGGARPARDFPQLAEAYLTGVLKLDELIADRISLTQINEGFAALKAGETARTVIVF